MKKYVLSAVVAGLLVPMAYAMDGGAAPAVDVEVPTVEVEVEVAVDQQPVDESPVVDPVAIEDVPVETVEVLVETDQIRFLGPPEQAPGVEDGETVQICIEMVDGTVEKEIIAEGEVTLTEAELFDLASQSGGPVDENGSPVVLYSFGNVDGGELPQSAPVEGNGEVEVTAVETTAVEDSPLRSLDNIQPNFRGGITDRGAEALAASASIVVPNDDAYESDAPNPQMLNDEQRGAVRGLRTEAEPAKPRSGMSKLLSKFRKPKAEVTLASATTTDKALSSKLAEVDRMRDTALRTGDQKMLAKADKLEQELRAKAGKATKIPTRTK